MVRPRRLGRTARLIRTLVFIAVVVGTSALFVAKKDFASSPGGQGTTTSTTLPRPISTTTTYPSGPLGVGLFQDVVSEPGRSICPPLNPTCVTRSFQFQIFYPAITSGTGPIQGAEPARIHGPYPIVLFATGFDLNPIDYYPLIQGWVQAGFVVAAPIFPLTSQAALSQHNVNLNNEGQSDLYESDLLNQPQDIKAALANLNAIASNGGSSLYGMLDLSSVALAGQSDGGDTVLAAAYNSCCVIPGIKALAVLSGAEFPPYGGSYFSTPPLPLLVTQGSADTVNPPADSQQIFAQAPPTKYYLNLVGADHLAPYTANDPYEQTVLGVSVAFFDFYLKGVGTTSGLATLGNVAGVSTLSVD